MLVFVDEAGDTGLKLKQGSSQFFIITLIIFDEEGEALACDQRIALLRRELGVGQEFEFHFNETPRRIKDHFFKAIAPYDFFYVSTIINKRNLYGEGFKFKNSFYKYACHLVFDNAKQYLEHAIVVFDGSGSRQFKQELATYLRKRMNDDATLRIRKVKMQDSKNNNLIQLADMVCGAVNLSLKSSEDENWEYRRLIAHRELSAKMWPRRMNVEKMGQYQKMKSRQDRRREAGQKKKPKS